MNDSLNKREFFEKRRQKKELGRFVDDRPIGSATPASAPPKLDKSDIKAIAGIVKEGLKSEGIEESDGIIKLIDKSEKYLPLIMKFAGGFLDAAHARRSEQQPQENSNQIKPPPGWANMPPMEKLKFKYSRPEWYAQGLRYDEFISTGMISHEKLYPSDYQPPERNRGSQQTQQIFQGEEAQSIKELAGKYGEKYEEAPASSEAQPVQSPEQTKEIQPIESMVFDALKADNAKYLKLAVDKINSLTIADFEMYVGNIDIFVKKYKPFFVLIPIQLKDMLKQMPASYFLQIMKENCPEKYTWLENNHKIEKVTEVFEKLVAEL